MKHFDEWNRKKKELDELIGPGFFKEREIWITYCGINVGVEQDGNYYNFVRPVLVYKKFNNNQFLGIPLTTKGKSSEYCLNLKNVTFLKKESFVIISQMRVFDSKRLYRKLGRLGFDRFLLIIKSAELLTLPQGPFGHSDRLMLIHLYFCVKYYLVLNLYMK